jgi:phage terminase small subunit
MSLTPKQAAFVREYLVDLNATQAAIRAGYSAKTAASIGEENLRKPDIKAAIAVAMAERAKRTEVTADRVVQELAKLAFSDIRRIARWEKTPIGEAIEGKPAPPEVTLLHLVDSADLDDDAAASISEIKATKYGPAIKVHSKRDALVDLGRHLGLFKPIQVAITDPDGGDPFATLMELIAVGGRPRPGS